MLLLAHYSLELFFLIEVSSKHILDLKPLVFSFMVSSLKSMNLVIVEQMHIELWLLFIFENIMVDTIETLLIPTIDLVSDISTKDLGKQVFKEH